MATKAKQKNTSIKQAPSQTEASTQSPKATQSTAKLEFKIVRPMVSNGKSVFSIWLDNDLREWVRKEANSNSVKISDVVHQALYFARKHAARSQL